LQRALRSVRAQTRVPDELVVCDDCSDESVEALAAAAIEDSVPLKVLRNPQRAGANASRNRAVAASSGEVVMFLDDDDRWLPAKVERQLALLQDEKIGLVYCARTVVTDAEPDRAFYQIRAVHSGRLFPQILQRNHIGTTSSVGLRRSVFDRVGGFDEQLPAMQDWDLWIRCCRETLVGTDPLPGVLYTVNTGAGGQLIRDLDARVRAANYLLAKYAAEIQAQGPRIARKIRSELWGKVARAAAKDRYASGLRYALRSFVEDPGPRSLSAFLPDPLLSLLRRRF
jgi:glycosyltransferase involved in cell wall biosynthesis